MKYSPFRLGLLRWPEMIHNFEVWAHAVVSKALPGTDRVIPARLVTYSRKAIAVFPHSGLCCHANSFNTMKQCLRSSCYLYWLGGCEPLTLGRLFLIQFELKARHDSGPARNDLKESRTAPGPGLEKHRDHVELNRKNHDYSKEFDPSWFPTGRFHSNIEEIGCGCRWLLKPYQLRCLTHFQVSTTP